MNNELKSRLEAQRKWRETSAVAPAQRAQKRTSSKQPALLFFYTLMIAGAVILIALVGFLGWTLYLSAQEPSIPPPAIESVSTTTGVAATGGITTTTVCAGGFETAKLHVRFEPGLNSDVRGYLNEGETVTVLMDPQGEPITKTIDGVSWTLIELPINGWVSTSHLCK